VSVVKALALGSLAIQAKTWKWEWDPKMYIRFKHIFTQNVGECKEMNFKHSQMKKHFENCSLFRVPNFKDNSGDGKRCQNLAHYWKNLWNIFIENEHSHSPFWVVSYNKYLNFFGPSWLSTLIPRVIPGDSFSILSCEL